MRPFAVPDDTLDSCRVERPPRRLDFVLSPSNLIECDFARGVACSKKRTVWGVRNRGECRPGDYFLGLGDGGAGNGVDADGRVGGADGDLVRGGGGDGDGGEFKCKCGGWFESFVVDGYRAIC